MKLKERSPKTIKVSLWIGGNEMVSRCRETDKDLEVNTSRNDGRTESRFYYGSRMSHEAREAVP